MNRPWRRSYKNKIFRGHLRWVANSWGPLVINCTFPNEKTTFFTVGHEHPLSIMACSRCPTPAPTKTLIKNGFNYNTQICSHWQTLIQTPTATDTDANGLQTHLSGVGVGQCEHSIRIPLTSSKYSAVS